MCGYFCIRFNDFMLAGKTLTQFTNPFSPNSFKKNDEIVLNYFMNNVEKWMSATLIIYTQILVQHRQMTIRLNKINETKDCFIAETKERERTNEQKT